MNSDNPDPMGWPEENNSGYRNYPMSRTILLSAMTILLFVVVLMLFFHLYARWYFLHSPRRQLRRRTHYRRPTLIFFAADPSDITSASRGLDPTVINSLPVFTFSDATHKDPIECAVCLSEFEENESGRVLPNCKHSFHVDCIDMWFHSHSTCPLCRSLVEPPTANGNPETKTSTAEEQVVIAIPLDPVSAIEPCSSSRPSDEPHGSGSSATLTEDLRSKPAAIEVPRGNSSEFEIDLTRRDSPASHSFRSPMTRMLSLTRMLSREGRRASSLNGGDPPLSPSSSCRIRMSESDIERGGGEGINSSYVPLG